MPFSSKLEKNHEGYSGVLSLIGSLVADLAKESQEATVEEDHSQQEYEAFMAESAASRAQKGQGDSRIEGREGSCIREFGSIEGGARVCGDLRKRDGQGDQSVASELRLVASEF